METTKNGGLILLKGMLTVMFLAPEAKEKTQGIWIHLELIMYGEDFLNIWKDDEKGTEISWYSICDGGAIADKGEKKYPAGCFESIVDSLYGINYPDQEDKDMNISWEVRCYDREEKQIAELEFGYWNRDILCKIMQAIQEIIKDDRPLRCEIDTLNA